MIQGLDNYIMGVYDPQAPFNQRDEEPEITECYSECCGSMPLMADFTTGLCVCACCKEHAGMIGIDEDGNEYNMWEV